jgi:outer membrane cobalamin receptor
VTARSARAAAGLSASTGDLHVVLDAHAESARAQVPGRTTPERRVVGGHTEGSLTLPFGLTVDASTDADVVSDAGPLFSGRLRLSAGDTVQGAIAFARAARPPTLDELYAPRGFVLGNPALEPEVLSDVEGTLSVRLGAVLRARAALWAGRIDETILYLNRNAFEIAPENTGGAWRAGAEGALCISPAAALTLDTTIALLASRLDATDAALPLTPAFTAFTSLRVGPQDGGHLVARVTSRAASSATLFGTLVVPGYTLIDLIGLYPLSPHLALGVSVRNAFDVLDARDQNGLPLPGRLLFVSLEVTG